jgi:uncharacterized membrane protein
MNSNISSMNAKAVSPWSLTTRRIVMGAIFGAMTLALGSVGLGFIPVPNLSGAGTIMHIPTILGAIIGGPLVGMLCGAIFGGMALLAFPVFGPLVHIPSRLLIGLFTWMAYTGLRRANVALVPACVVAAIVGSLTNTVVTVGVAILLGFVPPAFFLTVLPQATVELIAAAVLTPIVVGAVDAVQNVRRG